MDKIGHVFYASEQTLKKLEFPFAPTEINHFKRIKQKQVRFAKVFQSDASLIPTLEIMFPIFKPSVSNLFAVSNIELYTNLFAR